MTSESTGLEPENARFFRGIDWTAFWTATVLTFGVYFYTLAPTVSLEDSGELAVAGDHLGVPHPPGYPLWSLISWIFTKIFAFVPYRGQPNPAWSIGLVSAVFGALAAGVTAMLICRSGSDMLHQSRNDLHTTEPGAANAICCVGGVVGSLLFAFTPAMWSQSVIVEVYSLNAFFLVFIFLLTYRWIYRPTNRFLYATGLVFGLGLTNYQVLLLAALPLLIAIMLRDRQLFRSFVIVGIPYVLVIGMMKKGYLSGISHPTHVDAFVLMSLNLLVLTTAYFFLPRGKTVALTILMVEIGVAFYIYMPFVSDLRNPPMNWGYPRTWEGFQHALTRGQYEKINPTDAFSMRFIEQVGSYLIDLRGQFTLPLALLGFLPFTIWKFKAGKREFGALPVAIILCVAAVLVLVIQGALSANGITMPLRFDKVLLLPVLLALGVGGMLVLVNIGWELWDHVEGKFQNSLWDRITDGAILLLALGVYGFWIKTVASKIKDLTEPMRDPLASPAAEQINEMMLQSTGLIVLMIAPLLLIALVAWLVRSRFSLRIAIDLNSQKWVLATLTGFMVMSLMLIVLANPKGDVQDNFIQRVKFISSHALFAIWIGYGLIFSLAWVDSLARGNRLVRTLVLTLACMGSATPIVFQNWISQENIRLAGGAEQHGHDFGWQFGNYQLRGADAISEELDPNEEPLPNPTFPPEMTQNAIFFGGTDPGRFVPTYMIYSARVREDVYLITQNALADNTFMNVTRDLYGDQIWIPAMQDSATAFQIYVSEVQSGKRQPHADLKIENGRVQVSGALGVMEINGILCKMIFDHNNYKHDFFVEESYVIRWMYPYLTPHGLIMKINADKTPLKRDLALHDLDFWDWYVRRFHSNPKFLRDIVARKSFSKLRSAIGGLYANRGQLAHAEQAFQEARILYSLSPEANFRLVQEVLLRQSRFAECHQLMEEFQKADPGNRRVPQFLEHLRKLKTLNEEIIKLEKKRRNNSLDASSALRLAELYRSAQQTGRFLQIVQSVLKTKDLPPQFAYQAATMLHKAKKYEEMTKALEKCEAVLPANTPPELFLNMARMYADASNMPKMAGSLQQYLKRKPDDWKAWLDLAYVYLVAKQKNAAGQALARAKQIGGAEAEAIIAKDKRFAPLRQDTVPQPGRPFRALPGVLPQGSG
jgi:tetratricopeptide (TPR) repeat protein